MERPRPLELDDLRRIIAEVDKQYGISSIIMGGGEPTADRSLPQILTSLAGRELKVLTNGYLLKRLLPAFVETGAKVVVSVKSVDDIELIIDTYIPVPGAPWRKPYDEELLKAREAAERHLRRVRVGEPGMEMKGRAIIIYPP